MRKLLYNNYEISTDDRKVVWVNGDHGCAARYSKTHGFEIYKNGSCQRGKGWKEFVSACKKEFDIEIPNSFSFDLSEPEPPPKESIYPFVWDLVVQDMRERDEAGAKKYLTRLRPHNGRDALVDAYQEALDLVVYLRQFIYEQSGR